MIYLCDIIAHMLYNLVWCVYTMGRLQKLSEVLSHFKNETKTFKPLTAENYVQHAGTFCQTRVVFYMLRIGGADDSWARARNMTSSVSNNWGKVLVLRQWWNQLCVRLLWQLLWRHHKTLGCMSLSRQIWSLTGSEVQVFLTKIGSSCCFMWIFAEESLRFHAVLIYFSNQLPF